MAESVIMPRQGQSVESCIFGEWFKEKGEKVQKGELLFSYETDKAAFEQEAPADGVLLETFVQEGDEVPVLQAIGVIGEEGEDVSALLPGGEGEGPSAEPRPEAEARPQEEADVVRVAGQAAGDVEATHEKAAAGISPRARQRARQEGVSVEGLSGTGPHGRIIERDIAKAAEKRAKATPLARSIARAENVPLPESGSGRGGRILASDVIIKPSVTLADDYTDTRLSNMRKIIAANMYESLANTAQLTLHTSADARRMLSLRKRLKEKMADGYAYNITINDMVCYAIIKALVRHPEANAHFMGDAIRTFSNVHLGFAVDTPRGLMVPTVKNANHLTIEGLSAEMKSLAGACQKGSLDPEKLQGATFTISNLGSYGIEMFTPVLNPPQVGIIGVNTITQKAATLGDGTFGFVPSIGLSLTFDHRALDGAPAAAFLQSVAKEIEKLEVSI